jgi:hypothetical protein
LQLPRAGADGRAAPSAVPPPAPADVQDGTDDSGDSDTTQ